MGSQVRRARRAMQQEAGRAVVKTVRRAKERTAMDTQGTKPIWQSKTFWVNVIALAALSVQALTEFVIDVETQAAILAVINLILRLVTKDRIDWLDRATGGGVAAAGLLVFVLASSLALTSCAGLQVCQEAAIVVSDADTPELTRVGLRCDGATVLEIDTSKLLNDDESEPISQPRLLPLRSEAVRRRVIDEPDADACSVEAGE